jgi:hypothetical protein
MAAGWSSCLASIIFGAFAGACADSSAVAIVRGETVGGAAGTDGRAPLQLLAESGTITGGFINTQPDGGYKVILDSAGDMICFSNVAMAGFSSATLRYGNGEHGGDTIQLTYPTTGTVIATFTLVYTGGWTTADMQDLTASFTAQMGSGQLCLIGQGSGWIASVDYVSLQ